MARTPRDSGVSSLDTLAGPDARDPRIAWPSILRSPAELGAPVSGRRIGWIGSSGGPLPDRARHPVALRDGARGLCRDSALRSSPWRPPFDPGRLWDLWLTLRGFAITGRLGGLVADPAKRPRIKPEAVWEVESAAGAGRGGRAGREPRPLGVVRLRRRGSSGGSMRWCCRARRSFRSLPAGAGRARWPGGGMATYHQWMEVATPATLGRAPGAERAGRVLGARGLPMGMQLVGRRGDDLGVLHLAEAYHRATDWPGRRPPGI